ncbi:hypothetical protein GNP95_15385 [Paenibacillus woosongensis]|uniref:Uncharacterized protein n=2 Tax=Paenibacillus woosongensis TaxID=307580 RepID=A0A7X2Z2M9_9BACL|nr:hypothetical protein [Paenibacillus woosongensis]
MLDGKECETEYRFDDQAMKQSSDEAIQRFSIQAIIKHPVLVFGEVSGNGWLCTAICQEAIHGQAAQSE